ncbi:hypothetical protein QOT17_025068 [Balamuthia mandrillaris]
MNTLVKTLSQTKVTLLLLLEGSARKEQFLCVLVYLREEGDRTNKIKIKDEPTDELARNLTPLRIAQVGGDVTPLADNPAVELTSSNRAHFCLAKEPSFRSGEVIFYFFPPFSSFVCYSSLFTHTQKHAKPCHATRFGRWPTPSCCCTRPSILTRQ